MVFHHCCLYKIIQKHGTCYLMTTIVFEFITGIFIDIEEQTPSRQNNKLTSFMMLVFIFQKLKQIEIDRVYLEQRQYTVSEVSAFCMYP